MKHINYSFSNRKKFINKNNNKKQEKEYDTLRKILLSIMIISLSFTVLISATKALFTGQEEIKTHIVTGNLDFKFERVNLTYESLNEKGYLEKYNDDSKINLKETGANAFNINEMVPGSMYNGTFNLVNIGSTAFTSKISFINLENSNEYILEQIKISLDYNNENITYSLIDFNKISLDLGVLELNENINFAISIYLPIDTNNDAQDTYVNFDLRLELTQVLYEK